MFCFSLILNHLLKVCLARRVLLFSVKLVILSGGGTVPQWALREHKGQWKSGSSKADVRMLKVGADSACVLSGFVSKLCKLVMQTVFCVSHLYVNWHIMP